MKRPIVYQCTLRDCDFSVPARDYTGEQRCPIHDTKRQRLPEVLAAHGPAIRVKHTLRPLGVAMAGRNVFDPYKD